MTRTYQAADACGNTADCAQVITVFDATIPTITCPANVSVQCAGLVPPVNLPLVGASDNCGSSVIVTFVADAVSSQTCTNQYVLTRTYRATDVCGNVAECTQVITVFDNTPPSISFVNPLLVSGGTLPIQCYGQDPSWSLPVFNAGSITATDICGGDVAVTFDEILVQEGSCKVDGFINLYRLTWTATDICGNSSTAFVFLALIDTIAPTISGIPADITVHCNDIPAVPTNVVGMDECLCACDITFEESIPLSGCLDGQVIVRFWSAKDRCGNITTQSQKITLIDDQGPDWLILQPEIAGITQDTIINYPCNDGFPAYLDLLGEQFALGSNSCGASFVLSFQVDTIISANCDLSGFRQQRTYHWTGVDECGNISSFTITARLVDKETPTIVGVPIDAVCIGNPVLNLVSSSDNCGTSTLQFKDTFVQNPCGTAKAIQRTFTAMDECGNMARDTALLIPNDQTQPLISFINPVLAGMEFGEILTTECASQSGTYTNFGAGDIEVQDACLEGLHVAFTETLISSGDCTTDGNLATVLLKWTATDICGNYNELSITAHIVDETSPVFVNFLPEITIGCNADLPELQIIDNCGSVSTSIWDTIIYGPCIFNYDMQRIITATDQCGNSSTAVQTIHVGDGSGPAMSEVEEMVCDDVSIPEVTAYDGCAESFVGVTMQADTLDLPCSGLMIKRTWTAVDNCGNSANRQQIILLNDTVPPVISTPAHSIIPYYTNSANGHVFSSQLDQIKLLNALDSSSVFVADDCDQLIIPVFNLEVIYADNCLEDGYFERRNYSWVFTDACGNSSAMSFSVDIIDDIPPVFVVMPTDVTIVCAPLPPVPVVFTDDNPLSVSIAYSESIEPGIGIGVFNVTRTWTATDACGNVTVYVQHIKWIPDTFLECEIELPAVVTCNTHGVMISSTYTGGNGPVSYVWEIVGENCFIQAGQGTPTIKIYMGWTDAELILTITDSAGCVSTCTATVSCLFSLDLFNGSPLTDTPDDSSSPFRSTLHSIDEDLKELNVWPNPSSGTINLSFVSLEENEVELIITNFLGESVFRNKTIAQKGLNTLKIDMSQMREGGYLIQLKTAKVVHTKTAVIMHNN
ncbi:MAG: T9SS type A sorting domain-containing protein [Saprospiraceae bacterium]|nr:T9SS type A sorting domain-containing protein [Saprospiraceae bacterium]